MRLSQIHLLLKGLVPPESDGPWRHRQPIDLGAGYAGSAAARALFASEQAILGMGGFGQAGILASAVRFCSTVMLAAATRRRNTNVPSTTSNPAAAPDVAIR